MALYDVLRKGRIVPLVALIFFGIMMWIYIEYAKRGKIPWVRRLAGFDAIEESVGRAAEMDRPVCMVPGRAGWTSQFVAQTVSGLAVLRYVAGLCARFDVRLWSPMASSLVMPIAIENVREAYAAEGKLEAFDAVTMVPFVSGSQFAWAAGVIGWYARERPAANIMIGAFWAESMMLAESASRVGAIQVGGTARLYQIPFFAAVCDYTLMGEEIFAASAYLTKDPALITTLATQDIFRVAGWVLIILGAILSTAGINAIYNLLGM